MESSEEFALWWGGRRIDESLLLGCLHDFVASGVLSVEAERDTAKTAGHHETIQANYVMARRALLPD
jgi:hypothetical protein